MLQNDHTAIEMDEIIPHDSNDCGRPKKTINDVEQMEINEKQFAKLLRYARENDLINFEKTLRDSQSKKIIFENFISKRNDNRTLLEVVFLGDDEDDDDDAPADDDRSEEVVELLLDIHETGFNFRNPFKENKTVLHHLVEMEKDEVLHVVLKISHLIDVNIQDDFGNTPLHLAAENSSEKIIDSLLSRKELDSNKTNNENKTALHIALEQEEEDKYIVWALIDHANYKIDQKSEVMMSQSSKLRPFKTVIEAFGLLSSNEMNKFEDMIRKKIIKVDDDNDRHTFLQYASMKGLHEAVQLLIQYGAEMDLYVDDDYDDTAFFLAGKGGFHKVLDIFINRDKELAKLPNERESRLIYDDYGDTILHVVLVGHDYLITCTKLLDFEDDGKNSDCDREKCVQLLLENNHYDDDPRFDINGFNWNDQTPLEVAIEYNRHENIIHLLLKNGAYIGRDYILHRIDPNIFETFLDDSVNENSYFKKKSSSNITKNVPIVNGSLNGSVNENSDFKKKSSSSITKSGTNVNDNSNHKKQNDKKSNGKITKPKVNSDKTTETKDTKTNTCKITEIYYDYQFLCPPELNDDNSEYYKKKTQETYALVEMSKIHELRHLLKHPTIASFVTLKWNLIRIFFWIDMIFYSLFCFFFTWHVLHALKEHDTGLIGAGETENSLPYSKYFINALDYITYTLLFLLFVRETLQIYFGGKSFLKNIENYLEMIIIVVGASYKFIIIPNNLFAVHFGALIIIFCWAELILLVSKHPYFATELEMLKVIAVNSFKFFVWYMMLICAFGLSFNILFHYNENNLGTTNMSSESDHQVNTSAQQNNYTTPAPTSKDEDKFKTWPHSIFKTFLMSLGEFNGDDLNFDYNPVISYVFFFLFVFLVAIIFFNLFIGVAVSDTEKIQNDARMLEIISRVQNIQFMEKMAEESRIFRNFIQFMSRCFNSFYSDVNLFPNIMKHKKIIVDWENNANRISFSNRNLKLMSFVGEIQHWFMHSFIVEESLSIIRRRKQESSKVTLDEIRSEISSINKRLEIHESR